MTKAEKAAMPRPLKLRALLAIRGIKHDDIVASLRQSDGRTLSRTMFSLWMNKGRAPARTSVEELKTQVVTFLRDEHVPEADIATAFEPEESNRIISVVRTNSPTLPPREPEIKPVEPAVINQSAREFFGLMSNPFVDEIGSAKDVMLWTNNRFVSGSMLSAARTGGLLAVVGESGAGKTVLRKKFVIEAAGRSDELRIIQTKSFDKSKMHAAAICEAIVQDLAPGRRMKNSLEARARQVEDELKALFATGVRAAMVIEEAHDLPIATLKYLKRFWEIEAGDGWKRPLAIILVAQPELKNKLNERLQPDLREFIRRCEVVELTPLDDRIEDYLRFKFERVNVDIKKVFAPDAYAAIVERLTLETANGKRSLCYPLVINNLVARAMNDAVLAGEKLVGGDVIKQTARV